MKKTLMTLAAVATASAAALPVLAQQAGETSGTPTTGQQMQGQSMQAQQQPGQQQAQQMPGQQQDLAMQGHRAVIGEIVDMRLVNVQGAAGPHHVLELQNDQKERLVVDLGLISKQQAQQFAKGQRIAALGKEARINGDPVLYARYVAQLQPVGKLTPPQTTGTPAAGQQMYGQPQQAQQQPQQQQQQALQQQQQPGQQLDLAMQGRRAVIGEIVDMRRVNVQGAEGPHHVVVLQNPQEERLVVDLGIIDKQQARQFAKGQRIAAIGKEARINGDPVLQARYVAQLQPVGKLTPPRAGQAS